LGAAVVRSGRVSEVTALDVEVTHTAPETGGPGNGARFARAGELPRLPFPVWIDRSPEGT
jgi:hypothetical protein